MLFQLSDQQVIDSFHALLQTSLAQAKAERLLDSDILSSAEADLMICGASDHSSQAKELIVDNAILQVLPCACILPLFARQLPHRAYHFLR